MATTTPNLGLTLPGLDDQADVAVLNQDFSLIDAKIGQVDQNYNTLTSSNNSLNVVSGGSQYIVVHCTGNRNALQILILVNVGRYGVVDIFYKYGSTNSAIILGDSFSIAAYDNGNGYDYYFDVGQWAGATITAVYIEQVSASSANALPGGTASTLSIRTL